MTLLSGYFPEWYAISALQGGQFSTGSSRIMRSLKTITFSCLKSEKKCRMLRIVSEEI
jgi:hypothetical protein